MAFIKSPPANTVTGKDPPAAFPFNPYTAVTIIPSNTQVRLAPPNQIFDNAQPQGSWSST